MSGKTVLSARPIVGFVGAFGSGKTEAAIGYCRAAAAAGERVCLVDLDVVTPYFRAGDYREKLGREGIQVIAAPGGLASYEVPALPPEIGGTLDSEEVQSVLDVGGDPVGARLLGSYGPLIARRGYDLWLVANPYRPETADARALEEQADAIERSSGLRLSGVAANPNLGPGTRWAEVESGLRVIEEAAAGLGLPVVLLAVTEELMPEAEKAGYPMLRLSPIARPPWEHAGED